MGAGALIVSQAFSFSFKQPGFGDASVFMCSDALCAARPHESAHTMLRLRHCGLSADLFRHLGCVRQSCNGTQAWAGLRRYRTVNSTDAVHLNQNVCPTPFSTHRHVLAATRFSCGTLFGHVTRHVAVRAFAATASPDPAGRSPGA